MPADASVRPSKPVLASVPFPPVVAVGDGRSVGVGRSVGGGRSVVADGSVVVGGAMVVVDGSVVGVTGGVSLQRTHSTDQRRSR